MAKVMTAREIQEEYGLSRRKTDELLMRCNLLPRTKKGKRYVLRGEFEKVLRGDK